MILYKLYVRDQEGEEHFLGILPERRNDPKRITDESVANLSKSILGPDAEILLDSLRFVQVGSIEDSVSGDSCGSPGLTLQTPDSVRIPSQDRHQDDSAQ